MESQSNSWKCWSLKVGKPVLGKRGWGVLKKGEENFLRLGKFYARERRGVSLRCGGCLGRMEEPVQKMEGDSPFGDRALRGPRAGGVK